MFWELTFSMMIELRTVGLVVVWGTLSLRPGGRPLFLGASVDPAGAVPGGVSPAPPIGGGSWEAFGR